MRTYEEGRIQALNLKHEILLIEDEKNICNFIATTLRTQDYKVSFASDAANGLSLAASACPDLILLDLGLPDMDGIDVIHSIRKWSNIPIIGRRPLYHEAFRHFRADGTNPHRSAPLFHE